MLSFGALRAWVPLVGRGLLWTFALAVFAHLGGATWHHRNGPAPRARWGWSGLAAHARAALLERRAETAPRPSTSATPCRPTSSPEGPKATTADGKVILNRAGVRDLVRLPGVGPKRAEAILAVRKRLGDRFRSVRQLMRVRGIGPRSLKKLIPHITLDPPPPPAASVGTTSASAPVPSARPPTTTGK
ncbi:MAG: helix-hairpin-helix domain-containing protein [Myxococcota bacterium]